MADSYFTFITKLSLKAVSKNPHSRFTQMFISLFNDIIIYINFTSLVIFSTFPPTKHALNIEPERKIMKTLMSQFSSVLFLLVNLVASQPARADVSSVHGMLLFGGGASGTYVSHLPMFHAPHDYQLVMSVALDKSSPAAIAFKKLQDAGETLFTIEPKPMDLTLVMSGKKKEFQADLYQGHFERGGNNLGKTVVSVVKIILSEKLNANLNTQDDEEYLIFGGAGEYFAAHKIKGKPSFDQILKVNQPYQLDVPHCRTRVCDEPKKVMIEDSKLPIVSLNPQGLGVNLKSGDVLGGLGFGVTEILNVIYLEQNELAH